VGKSSPAYRYALPADDAIDRFNTLQSIPLAFMPFSAGQK
jgi:hypothetical protein